MFVKTALVAALAAAACTAPALAATDAMAADHGHGMMAEMVCRQAQAGERPTAMMMDAKTGLVCKSVAMDMSRRKAGPDFMHALSAEQVDMAWRLFVDAAVAIPVTGGG